MIGRRNKETALFALIAIFAVLVSFAHVDGSEVRSGEAHAVIDLDHEHTTDQHAHGCGTCHFHAYIENVGMKVEPTTLAPNRLILSSELLRQTNIDPLLRPPSA